MKKLGMLILALVLSFALVACGSTPAPSGGGDSFSVGVVQLVQHDALDAATQGFVDALTEKMGDRVTVDVKNASGEPANCATIVSTFITDEVDLIMANATPALNAAAAATDTIPILGTSITEYGVALDIEGFNGVSGRNVSGTSDLAPLDEQAQLLQDLFPDSKTVGILFCSSEANSKYQVETITGFLEGLGKTVKAFSFTDSNDVTAVTQSAVDECDVLYIPTDNTAASCTEAINNVALPANVPIIAGEEGICAGCGVATLTISYYDIGYATGLMAVEILDNGADVSTMPIEYAPQFVKKFNPTLAEAFGLTFSDDFVAIGG